MIQRRTTSFRRSQEGAILLISLLLLLGMTIIGVAAIDSSTLQSQMARNSGIANVRYQITVNETEGLTRKIALDSVYMTSITKGTTIPSTPVGVTKSGPGLVITDTQTINPLPTADLTDEYSQMAYAVFQGFEGGAYHGMSIGDVNKAPIELNVISTLNGTQSKTDHTRLVIFPAPGGDDNG